MKFWLSFGIAWILIVALLRFHYATPVNRTVNNTSSQSLARKGIEEMGNISNNPSALDKAIANFVEALRADPNDPLALFGLGWARQTKGETAEAERIYSQALIQNNEICKYTHFNLSFIKETNGDIPSALSELQKAKDCDPSFAPLALREQQLKSLLTNKAVSTDSKN